ncbi:MAG: hypothetical protein ACOX1V_02050 [Candidatus Iainarchaeum sp.]
MDGIRMIDFELSDKDEKDLEFIRKHYGLSKKDEIVKLLIKKEIWRLSGGEPTYEFLELKKIKQ